MNVSPCQETTGLKISCVEDFLVALLWRAEMWELFSRATSKRCVETPATAQAVWCFSDEADANRLVVNMAEALDGEEFSVWAEPVIGGGFCAHLYLRAQVLEPVS